MSAHPRASATTDDDRAKLRRPRKGSHAETRPTIGEPNAVAPARACAYAVVRRVFEQGAWADRALHGEARRARLDARDLALATQLAYGTVQRVATLDHVIDDARRRARPAKLDPPVLAALRLGVFQLTFLDRVPAHAAVGESVELAKRDAPRGAGLVNAVLRRAAREARAIVADAARHARPPRPRSPTRHPSGSPSCGSTRSARETPAR